MEDLFDIRLQSKIIALMVKDNDFMAKNYKLIRAAYFESDMLMDFCRIITLYYNKYKGLIPINILLKEVMDYLEVNPKPNPMDYVSFVQEIKNDTLVERNYVKDYIKDFVKMQEYKLAIDQSIDHLKNKEFEKIDYLMSGARKAGMDTTSGIFYFDDKEIDNRYEESTSKKVGTGFPEIDRILGGGLEAGELGIILAPPNVGKSKQLVYIGSNGLRNKEFVAHFSHEMKAKKIALRYDRNILGKSIMAIKDDFSGMKDKLLKWHKDMMNNLYIKDWPTRTCTVHDLKVECEYLQASGFPITLGITDYAAIMKPSRSLDGRHQEIEEINEELRGLSGELGFPFWTAAQTTKDAVKKKVITIEDFGESFAQSKVADVVLGICQTEEEYLAHEMRIFVCKNRDNEKFQTFQYKTNDDIMRVTYVS